MDTVRIMLRFHSLFYTPHFVAMHLGVFERQKLGVEVRTANSGGELASALLNGAVELGLSGPIRGLDLAEKGSRDRIISIIQVTNRDGFFVVGRGPQPRFQWADLMGSRLILIAEAETPWLCLRQVLRNYGIDIGAINLITGVPTAQAVEMFLRGEADYIEQGQ